jgi:hypothetical protein
VVCSTFNFQRMSGLWEALWHVARRPEITMKVYMDTNAADEGRWRASSPTTDEVAVHLGGRLRPDSGARRDTGSRTVAGPLPRHRHERMGRVGCRRRQLHT